MARAQIAASLDLYGEKGRAGNAFASAFRLLKAKGENWSRSDYGSRLRDGAALLALAAESRPTPGSVAEMIDYVAGQRVASDQTSTQENAWLLLAARAVQAEGGSIRLNIDGTETQGNYARTLSGPELVQTPITVTNVGTGDVAAVVTVTAVPEVPLPAGGQGFTIERNYFHLDGSAADASRVAQNERLVAVVKVTQTTSWPARIAITDLLPAGFEVDNPKLVQSADLAAFDWLPEITVAHSEVRVGPVRGGVRSESGGNRRAHLRLCGPGGVAWDLCPSAGTGRGHVPPASQCADRNRQDGSDRTHRREPLAVDQAMWREPPLRWRS